MSTPSTKITPAPMSLPSRAPFAVISSGMPFLVLKIRSAGIPTDSASCACRRSRLWSPWIGITYFGLVRLSISFISSCQPWPEAWIGASLAVITRAPISKMRSIVSLTERSLPGIGVALKTTVSPECSSTSRCSPAAIRRSADSGSPWEPVEIAITSSSG